MKPKALLRTLLLAWLVMLAGCSVSRPAADTTPPPPPPAGATGTQAEPEPPKAPVSLPPPVLEQAAPSSDMTAARTASFARRATAMPSIIRRPTPMPAPRTNTENYPHHDDNPVQLASEQPVSTFSIDVDTGAYANVRRMLNAGYLPPADAVRAEEFINYFDYGYTPPTDREHPFNVTTELAPAPWNAKRLLLLIGIQGYRVPPSQIPASNLVFLIDTSGSMAAQNKLPLLKASLKQLVRELRPQDRLAIVTYAGSAGVALPSTAGDQHATINAAIDSLHAAGATNGSAGLKTAYIQAAQGFIKNGVNRVILASDGDFNVGLVNQEALKNLVEERRKSGIALTTLGFGEGNYNDAMAMTLADAGNGSYHYIDNLQEGRRVLVDEMSATLLTIAGDVKIQIEFNPAKVQEYRLIGYEKRMLDREDFNNDKVDAGEIGAGANVTAIYEIIPAGSDAARIDPLRYGERTATSHGSNELAFLRLRYKLPGHEDSTLTEQPISAQATAQASERLRYAAAVAAFADALRGAKYLDGYSYTQIAALANSARGDDVDGYRAGFVQLVKLAGGLATQGHDDASDTATR